MFFSIAKRFVNEMIERGFQKDSGKLGYLMSNDILAFPLNCLLRILLHNADTNELGLSTNCVLGSQKNSWTLDRF